MSIKLKIRNSSLQTLRVTPLPMSVMAERSAFKYRSISRCGHMRSLRAALQSRVDCQKIAGPDCFADVTNISCNNGANDCVRKVV